MQRQDYITKIGQLLSRLVYEVKVANAIGLFDINKVAEDFYAPILSTLFDCPNLRNQNRVRANFPAVDLGCETTKIAFQVTSDPSSAKITETLRLFKNHQLGEHFDTVYVFVITEKQASYTSQKLKDQIQNLGVNFSISDHIIDCRDIAAKLPELDINQLKNVFDILHIEFGKKDAHLRFKETFDQYLEFAQSKIEFEKNSKKYIPDVFIETSSSKDLVRHFANPIFFHGRITEALGRVRLDRLNELLGLAGIDPLIGPQKVSDGTAIPSTLDDLRTEQVGM